ncbi:MAG: YjbQ family protein, partial [Verrucomicrobiaceae bacterium]
MTAHNETFSISTRGKGTTEITREVMGVLIRSGVKTGTVTVFVRHTSASLVIMENADPSARRDLEMFFEKLVPENTPW